MIWQVEPLCKLLIQSRETLTSLEFIHCKLSSSFIGAICASLHEKDIRTNGIQRFCIKTSSIDIDPLAAPSAFIPFLNSVRYTYELMPKCVFVKYLLIWLSKSLFLADFDVFSAFFSVFVSEHFLFSFRSLHSLHFCDSHLDRHIARMVFSTLLDSSSDLSSLDLSENNVGTIVVLLVQNDIWFAFHGWPTYNI